jgi:predicted HTH transcriptional regulator
MAFRIEASESIGAESAIGSLVAALKQEARTTRELAIILGRGISSPAIDRYLKQLAALGVAARIGKQWRYIG